jgi:membrane protein
VLLFLNLVSRLLLYASAFVVTGPYDSDVAPSGTASPELARRAGIPEHYATRPEPPAVREDGAPSPLPAVLGGRTPPQDEPDGGPTPPATPGATAPTGTGTQGADGRLPSPQAVQTAARLVSAVAAVGLGAVAWYAAGALRRVVRG